MHEATIGIDANELLAELGIENGDVALDFFVCFSRFEYALKRAGYATGNSNGINADWKRFAQELEYRFDPNENEKLSEAVSYLEAHPPRKQVLVEDQIRFVQAGGLKERLNTSQLVDIIYIIRSNLFHGGKYPNGPEGEPARNTMLLRSSLIVLRQFLSLNAQVKHYFIHAE